MDNTVKSKLRIVLFANNQLIAECYDQKEWFSLLARIGQTGTVGEGSPKLEASKPKPALAKPTSKPKAKKTQKPAPKTKVSKPTASVSGKTSPLKPEVTQESLPPGENSPVPISPMVESADQGHLVA